jgi:hypothetical protein
MSHQIASELRWPRLGENRSLWFSQVIAEITKDGALALVASATITEADPEPDADDASKAAADSDGKSTDAAVAEAEVASEQSAIVPSA